MIAWKRAAFVLPRIAVLALLAAGCAAGPQSDEPAPGRVPAAVETAGPSEPDDCEPPVADATAAGPEAGGAGEVGEGMDKPTLRIVIFSIGQADAMLLQGRGPGTEVTNMLVDLGEPVGSEGAAFDEPNYAVVGRALAKLVPSKKLDYFVLTHFHTDHAGLKKDGIFGLVDSEGFKIGRFIHPGSEQDAHFHGAARAVYKQVMKKLGEWGSSGMVAQSGAAKVGESVKLGSDATVTVLAAGGKVSPTDKGTLDEVVKNNGDVYASIGPPSENDLSIALLVRDGQFELFSAGDLTGASAKDPGEDADYTARQFGGGKGQVYSNVEKRLLAQWNLDHKDMDVEVYRANHHGSDHSSTPRLINALDPEFVIYSCGGMYGHPSHEVASRCKQTAKQLVTTRLDAGDWTVSDFKKQRGQVVGHDIRIEVGKNGLWYTINGSLHRAYNDAQEKGDVRSPAGAGDDVGEEDRFWQMN